MHDLLAIKSATDIGETRGQTAWQGPLFVVGIQRSGTSLLYALINKHPQIALMYEADFFRLTAVLGRIRAGDKWISKCEFWNQVCQRHALDPSQISMNGCGLKAGMENVCREYAHRKGARIWGDKSPNYHDFLEHLAQDLPLAKFVIIWRNPIAVARSIARAAAEGSWFARVGMNHRALLGHQVLKAACDRLVRDEASIYQVRYEELVRDPQGTLAGICAFLDVPFVPAMISLEGADRSAIYEGGHHSLVKGERVLSNIPRPEIIPDRLKRKIERYIRMWQRKSRGKWPVAEVGDGSEPSLAERVRDQILYRCLLSFDLVIVLVYFLLPIGILKMWRKWKEGRNEPSSDEAAHLSGSSSI